MCVHTEICTCNGTASFFLSFFLSFPFFFNQCLSKSGRNGGRAKRMVDAPGTALLRQELGGWFFLGN